MERKIIYNISCYLALAFCCLIPSIAVSQLDTSGLWVNIDSINISATRIETDWLKTTKSISQRNTSKLLGLNPQISLQEYIGDVAGVFSMNTNNMAQDLRISIRGFGSRSSFGVRGLKIIIDGIPETTADGQGQLDAIPLGLIRNVEIIKGPSATLYGQASGGVLSLNTLSEFNYNLLAKPLLETRILYGSFNTSQIQMTYGRKIGNTSYLFHGNQSRSDGYRNRSGFLNRNFKSRLDHRFSKFSKINLMVDFLSSPLGQDPGALVLDEVNQDRTSARKLNEDFGAGENIDHLKASVNYHLLASDNRTLDIYGFLTSRKFLGYLPFEIGGIVDLNRKYYGQGAGYTINSKKNLFDATFRYGYDLANQVDKRTRFSNLQGVQGPIDVLQTEITKNAGLYILSNFDFGSLDLHFGLRYDYNFLELKDELAFGLDDSGYQSYSNFNPSLGVNYQIDNSTSLFVNYSTGFDTPTFIELTNSPDSDFGLNDAILPQQSDNYELGAKVAVPENYSVSLTGYYISTSDELVPYALESNPNRVIYRNSGSTTRSGLELEGKYSVNEQLDLSLSYTLSSYKYENFEVDSIDHSGNYLPGIPKQLAFLGITYEHPLGIQLALNNKFVGSLYTSDANETRVDSYFLTDFYCNYDLSIRDYSLQPFIGLQNILDTEYFDNIRINGFGGRYFEPAPGFNFFGGVRLRL